MRNNKQFEEYKNMNTERRPQGSSERNRPQTKQRAAASNADFENELAAHLSRVVNSELRQKRMEAEWMQQQSNEQNDADFDMELAAHLSRAVNSELYSQRTGSARRAQGDARQEQLRSQHIKKNDKAESNLRGDINRDNKKPHRNIRKKKMDKKTKRIIIISAAAVAALLCVFAILLVTDIKPLMSHANEMKDSMSKVVSSVSEKNMDGAEEAVAEADAACQAINKILKGPQWAVAQIIPVVGGDIRSVKILMSIYADASEYMLKPLLSLMREQPLDNLKVDDGFNITLINHYLDFADSITPQIDNMNKKMQKVKFRVLPKEKIEGILGKFTGIFGAFDTFKKFSPMMRAFFGNGEDKGYLVLAQNSAEIRASGGFPGSVGTITIRDGVLRIGDFSSIVNSINMYYPDGFSMPENETALFGKPYSYLVRDACYNPHFERMASLIKQGYNYELLDRVDGVVSLTPIVIERLMKISGGAFTIDDGTEITAENALQIIQNDLYFKQGTGQYTNDYVDSLFSEAAKKAMKMFTESFDVKHIADYIDFFQTGFSDRSIMIWIEDEEGEEAVKQCGASGNLNFNSLNPEAGIFFSCWDPARLGIFTDIQPKIINETTNENGQKEYTVEVTYFNAATDKEINLGDYLTGHFNGGIPAYIYFFAPAGGEVSDFTASNNMVIKMSEYMDLQVAYSLDFFLYPGETVVITYKVTTAKDAEPLRLVMTPTVRNTK